MNTDYTIDQIKELKVNISKNRTENPQKSRNYCLQLEEYARKKNDHELLGYTAFFIGESFYLQNHIEPMLENMARSVPYLTETRQWGLLARAYNLMAITSINKGQAPVAVDYYLSALACTKEHDLAEVRCSININLGYLYMQNGIYGEAENHFQLAYRLYEKLENKRDHVGRLNMIYTNLANCYIFQKNAEKAGEYIKKIDENCRRYFQDMEYVYVGCMEARYYDLCGEYEKRDTLIRDILHRMSGNFPVLDLFDDVLYLCKMVLELKQYDTFLLLANKLRSVVENTHMVSLEKQILSLFIEYYQFKGEKENLAEATLRFFELSRIMEEDGKKMIANMIYVRTLLEKANETQKEMEAENAALAEKSETDALTGLANRYRLTEYLQVMLEQCSEKQQKLAFEILDIDYFKKYNDTYGHQAGDEALIRIASVLKRMENDRIFCARYGGDEFILIYSGLEEQEVTRFAKLLREEVRKLGLLVEEEGCKMPVTISQGICCDVPAEKNKTWNFMHTADEYLYQIKKQGKNGIRIGKLKSGESN